VLRFLLTRAGSDRLFAAPTALTARSPRNAVLLPFQMIARSPCLVTASLLICRTSKGKNDAEGAARSDPVLDLDSATESLGDAAAHGEAETGAMVG
jgi:hypothetical protein